MKKTRTNNNKGFTLIETVIYIALLSILMSSVIQYAWSITKRDTELRQRIESAYAKRGLASTIAIMITVFGMMGMMTVTAYSAGEYADQVDRRELRIQTKRNLSSCIEWIQYLIDDDSFLEGELEVRHFGCKANIRITELGEYEISATSTLEYVNTYGIFRYTRDI